MYISQQVINELQQKISRHKTTITELTERAVSRGVGYTASTTEERELKSLSKALDLCTKELDRLLTARGEVTDRSRKLKESESGMQELENSLEVLID